MTERVSADVTKGSTPGQESERQPKPPRSRGHHSRIIRSVEPRPEGFEPPTRTGRRLRSGKSQSLPAPLADRPSLAGQKAHNQLNKLRGQVTAGGNVRRPRRGHSPEQVQSRFQPAQSARLGR